MTRDSATLVHLLRSRADHRPDAAAYTFLVDGECEGASFTYAELDARARAIAVALRQHGVRPGDRALLIYPPSLDFIPAFFGCLYAGVVAVPTYPPQPAQATRTLPRLLSIVADADVSIVLCNTTVADGAAVMRRQAAALDAVPWLRTETVDTTLSASWDMPTLGDDPLAFLQYTSGSTASPKGVMVGHRNGLEPLSTTSPRA